MNDLHQAQDQVLISLSGDHTTQSQTGIHHDRHGQPDDLTLCFDPDFISLPVLKVSGV